MYWIAFIFAFLLIIAKPSRHSWFRGREYVWKYEIYFSTFLVIFLNSVRTSYSVAEDLSVIIFGDGHIMETLAITAVLLIVLLFFIGDYYITCAKTLFEVQGEGDYETNTWLTGEWKVIWLYIFMSDLCLCMLLLLQKLANNVVDLLFASYEVSVGILIASFAIKWVVCLPLIIFGAYKIFDKIFHQKILLM